MQLFRCDEIACDSHVFRFFITGRLLIGRKTYRWPVVNDRVVVQSNQLVISVPGHAAKNL